MDLGQRVVADGRVCVALAERRDAPGVGHFVEAPMLELGQDLSVPDQEEGPYAPAGDVALDEHFREPFAQRRQRVGRLSDCLGLHHVPRLPDPGVAAVDLEEQRAPEPVQVCGRDPRSGPIRAEARWHVPGGFPPCLGQGTVNIGLAQPPVEDLLLPREREQAGEARGTRAGLPARSPPTG